MIYTTKRSDTRKVKKYEGLTNSQATMKYNKEFSIPVMLRLNKVTDRDIIEFLDKQNMPKATLIKIILRNYIKSVDKSNIL